MKIKILLNLAEAVPQLPGKFIHVVCLILVRGDN